jgi:hypothetical protein
MFECVQFGDAKAIELRGNCLERTAVYYLFLCALNQDDRIPKLAGTTPPIKATEFDDFVAECRRTFDEFIDPKLRWLMLCTAVEFFTDDHAKRLEDMCEQHLGFRHTFSSPSGEVADAVTKSGLTFCNRTIMLDRETFRIFFVPFDFSEPIYKPPGSLLAGVLLRQSRYKKNILLDPLTEDINAPPTAAAITSATPTRSSILSRLRRLMIADMPVEAESQSFTEFIIYDVKMWCGDSDGDTYSGTVWLAQQLNVWFNTPDTWYRPNSRRDVCSFRVALFDNATAPSDDTRRLKPVPAPSLENTFKRYPRTNCTVTIPQITSTVGIGHFLPLLDDKGNDWVATHHLCDVRLFRVYKTQYPFVYTLMPDNDDMVKELKSKLKTSTDSNPNIGEKGKEVVALHAQQQPTPKYAPLVVTLPTLECNRYVSAVFRETPKFQYRLFYCARYDDENGLASWIPVMPSSLT